MRKKKAEPDGDFMSHYTTARADLFVSLNVMTLHNLVVSLACVYDLYKETLNVVKLYRQGQRKRVWHTGTELYQ